MKIADVVSQLADCQDAVILTHRSPDGDTLGSAFALCRILRKMGKRAQVLYDGVLYERFEFLENGLEKQEFEPKTVIAVDIADNKLMPAEIKEKYGECVDLCIDHHGSNTKYAKNTYVDSSCAAVGEIIYQLANMLAVELDTEIAKAIYTAISTDTGCFRFGNTTAQSHKIAAQLMEFDICAEEINRVMFESFTKQRVELEQILLQNLEYFSDDKGVIMLISQDAMEKSGACDADVEGLAAIPRSIKGVMVGITMKEKNDGFKISVRTTPQVNACSICSEFGGGGHTAAAGGYIKGTLEEAKNIVIEASKKYISQVL